MNINTDYSYYNSSYYTQQAAKRQKPSLNSLIDSNEDKNLGADELENFTADYNAKTGSALDLSSIMSAYDLNNDGSLDESEQETMNKDRALEKLMANGMQNRQMRRMDETTPPLLSDIDQDGDGSWNNDELTQFISLVNEATGSDLTSEDVLAVYDTDGDGLLSQSEQAEMIRDMTPPPPKSPDVSTDKDYDRIREKMDELLKLIEERVTKKEEENTVTEDALSKAEAIKIALQKRLSQSIGNYEKSFWFENTVDESNQYGA